MNLSYTKEFVKTLERLPTDIQKLYLRQEKILKKNYRDPRLHIKKLKEKPIIYSLRITRSYRAFFYFRAHEEITLFALGHRKDVYRKL